MRGLRPQLEGACIVSAEARRRDLRFPLPDGFAGRLQGRVVLSLTRRAKYILIRLDDGWTWLSHLGMTGCFRIDTGPYSSDSPHTPEQRHDHLILGTDRQVRLVYNDVRRFGFMDLIPPNGEGENRHLAALGPEPLGDGFTAAYLARALAARRTSIKAALLDQRLVAGLGNIYVSEILWRTGITPRRDTATVGPIRCRRLVAAVRAVLEDAIAAGGSSLRDFRHANGDLGYFQHHWNAYGRAGEACTRPDCDGRIRRIVQSGRTSYYCPRHQR